MFEHKEKYCANYIEKCRNCHKTLADGDKYCRYCGTKRGDGEFKPYLNMMQCIYGPMPIKRLHKCTVCGFTWERELMIDIEYYCPRCGGKAEIANAARIIVEKENTVRTESIITLISQDINTSFSSEKKRRFIIGRMPGVDISIANNNLSSEHASIEYDNNQWYLQDLGSSKGTLLNAEALTQFKKKLLSNGDVICLGGSVTITVLISTQNNG